MRKRPALNVALIQESFKGSKDKTIRVTKEKIAKASKKGAKLVVLQELHQSEYFCQCEDTKYFDYASSFEDDIRYWSKIAKKYEVVLVTSLFEQRAIGLYHNTAVIFDSDGSIAGKYRKMHIPDDPGFYEKFYFTEGDLGFEPVDTSVGRLGVLICWDQWYPEAARVMALKGAEILIYPTAIGYLESPKDRRDELCEKENSPKERKKMLDAWIGVQRGHAIANGIPLLSVNRVGFEADKSGQIGGIKFWGHSFALGSQGELLAMANEVEEVLYLTLDLDTLLEVRKIWPFLRDRRIDSYGELLLRYAK